MLPCLIRSGVQRRWKGLPESARSGLGALQREKHDRERSLEKKKDQLSELLVQQIAFRNLARRNRFNSAARAAAAEMNGDAAEDAEEVAASKVRRGRHKQAFFCILVRARGEGRGLGSFRTPVCVRVVPVYMFIRTVLVFHCRSALCRRQGNVKPDASSSVAFSAYTALISERALLSDYLTAVPRNAFRFQDLHAFHCGELQQRYSDSVRDGREPGRRFLQFQVRRGHKLDGRVVALYMRRVL